MYANGWVNETVLDQSRCQHITQFEKGLPLRNISLNEFERRLKKMVRPQDNNMVKVRVLEESFRDHWAFPDIQDEETLSRELLFDPMFLEQEADDDANN